MCVCVLITLCAHNFVYAAILEGLTLKKNGPHMEKHSISFDRVEGSAFFYLIVFAFIMNCMDGVLRMTHTQCNRLVSLKKTRGE